MKCILIALSSISLISSEIDVEKKAVHKLGREELLALPLADLASFLWNRYVFGQARLFEYYGANPKVLTREASSRPATILIHASESNQGQWMNLLAELQKNPNLGPVFTFNYEDGEELLQLTQKIASIKELYSAQGVEEVEINLVGHSLGGIVAAEYAYSPKMHPQGVYVKKVIAIAARLKSSAEPEKTPFYHYALDAIERAERVSHEMERNPSLASLYTIAAENDWLVPRDSALAAPDKKQRALVQKVGHVTIAQSQSAVDLVIRFLADTN
jgi:thioesterase domain-containing protein